MTPALTPRMAECLAAIRRLSVDGVAPSISELQTALGMGRAQVHDTLSELKDRGAITWTPRARRSLRIIERPSRADLALLSDGDLRAVMNDAIDLLNRRDDARAVEGSA